MVSEVSVWEEHNVRKKHKQNLSYKKRGKMRVEADSEQLLDTGSGSKVNQCQHLMSVWKNLWATSILENVRKC